MSAVAAFAAATWVYERPASSLDFPDRNSFDSALPATDRLAVLERAISEERLARQLLQEEVMVLTAELEALHSGPGTAQVPEDSTGESSREAQSSSFTDRRRDFMRRNSSERRLERLIEAGFLPSEADRIMQREQELQMEALQARYEAGRSGDPADFFRDQVATGNSLREELGDADYERYLEANGRSTSVAVSSIIGNSPAQSAGIQPGDEIVRYDGERVFSMTDINLISMEGEAGQSVTIDFTRDGVPMQVVMPRGPLGVTGGRRRN
jgi:C-terminal processing protease CtpA/Prc